MSESGYLISKTDGSKDGYNILSLIAASTLYELSAYWPPHLFTIFNFGTELTPSTFATINSNSEMLIVLLKVKLSMVKYSFNSAIHSDSTSLLL